MVYDTTAATITKLALLWTWYFNGPMWYFKIGIRVRSPRRYFSDESRRRGDVNIPWRRDAAPPRLRRGYSVETSRGAAAAAT